ncbi:hypothetical protein [Nonomuraea rhodomycinica]|uniref:SMI1/KNR4 family protein n=1 Tax=Nonomuraea rhodomycinica TaxID=1712872 RepID=A0A7Y6MGV7_9ACTN|nr:hypothetical protein [Nonomuraea rhodomycinica]NUW46324.1 hypothetical protein [Nonomuraea rhodomycinica]
MIGTEGSRLGARAARRLAELGCCEIAEGLSEAEFARIEREYGIEFAEDHRAFLAAGLPVRQPWQAGQTWENPWPDWRNGDPAALREHLDWPVDRLLSDVQHGHWRTSWGERPSDPVEAVERARLRLADAPQMVPVYAHRFLPAGRGTFGHPVLSMWGSDIIHYGSDLADYINQEFQEPRPERIRELQPQATVLFWRDYL